MKHINAYKSLSLILGFTIFLVMIWNFGFDKLIENIEKTGYWIVPIVGTWFFVYLFNTLSWREILEAKKNNIPFAQVFGLTVSGFSLNYITPFVGLGGEPFRIMSYKEYIGMHKSLSSVFVFTVMHMLSHVVFWLSTIVWVALFLNLPEPGNIILAVVAVCLLALMYVYILVLKKGLLATIMLVLEKLPFLRKLQSIIDLKYDELLKADTYIREFYGERRKSFYSVLFYEFISRIIASMEYYLILKAVGLDITMYEAVFINAATTLIINMVFFIPFQVGAREGSLSMALQIINLDFGVGIFVGLVNRVREFFWILIGLSFIYFTGRKDIGKDLVVDKVLENER